MSMPHKKQSHLFCFAVCLPGSVLTFHNYGIQGKSLQDGRVSSLFSSFAFQNLNRNRNWNWKFWVIDPVHNDICFLECILHFDMIKAKSLKHTFLSATHETFLHVCLHQNVHEDHFLCCYLPHSLNFISIMNKVYDMN